MSQSFIYNKEKLQEWQSSVCMIPVLRELIKEKFVKIHQNHHNHIPSEISAYQTIYKSWEKAECLNAKQKEWVREIGNYLNAIQQTVFHSQSKEMLAYDEPYAAAVSPEKAG